ncbi:MAG TPA: DUF433 domain-containing protein [Vicinamibacteria bacterium]|nr:DUF433 domain-containing protein [Vicinamibacteria bacterium]
MTTATVYSHITKDPEVCGSKACIDRTRLRVLDIVGLHRQGLKAEEMLHAYASPLTLAQVYAALSYAYDHPDEIEAEIRAGREAADQIEREREEYLKRRAR